MLIIDKKGYLKVMRYLLASIYLLIALFLPNSIWAASYNTIDTPSVQLNQAAPAAPQAVIVNITGSGFTPVDIQIAPGQTVTWVNQDSMAHTSTVDNMNVADKWDSGNINPGQSFSKTFTTPGVYTYHCIIHPNVRGTIRVGAAGAVAKELPRTGLPESALALTSLIPLGWGLSKFGKIKKSLGAIWAERQSKLH
jgi:plastocyanin